MYYVYRDDVDLTVSASEEEKSAKRYERLVELTLEITGLKHLIRYPEETWDPFYSEENLDPWDDLIYTWSRTNDKMQFINPMFTVLHKIKWARYPSPDYPEAGGNLHIGTPYESVMQELLLLFEEELCSAGRGLAALMKWQWYCSALNYIHRIDTSCTTPGLETRSCWHHSFLITRFSALSRPFDMQLGRAGTFKTCKKFMECVTFILPTASTWTNVEWCDEQYILSQIDCVYHTKYVQNPRDFDDLMELIGLAMTGVVKPRMPLKSTANLRLKLLETLWPNKIATVIQSLYNATHGFAKRTQRRIEKRPIKKPFSWELTFTDLKKSDIHRLAVEALTTRRIRSKKFRELVFNIHMSY